MSTPYQAGLHEVLSALETLRAWGRDVPVSRATLAAVEALASAEASVAEAPCAAAPAGGLDALREAALACTRCPHLVATRRHVVFGVGNPRAELMFVGEAPGADEDAEGEPFVGRAGQLLTRMIGAMELRREDVYIANVLKCRPNLPAGEPGNRPPTPGEMATCLPWLEKQIALIAPKVIVALGKTATEGLLGGALPEPIGRLRGTWLEFRGIALMPTYHPSYLLRGDKPADKRRVWEDMLAVLERLGRPVSEKQRRYFTAAV